MSRNARYVYDVIVVGGGASGMMTAIRAAERGLSVVLIEKNRVLGKKLSITGGGRCNITNAEFDTRILLTHYGEAAKFLHAPFARFGVQSTFDFFLNRGLPFKIEDRKRAFPLGESAKEVTALMEKAVRAAGVTVLLATLVTKLMREEQQILGVETTRGVYTAKSTVLATGGASYGETGSTGEGLSWLISLGHTVHASTPDIVPLTVSDMWVKKLSGRSLENVHITFTNGTDRIQKKGKILFTHFGLSGPLILNSSGAVKKLLKKGAVTATIDLFPLTHASVLEKDMRAHFELHKNKSLRNALRDILPPGMVDVVLTHEDEGFADIKVHSVTKEQRVLLAEKCKTLTCTIAGTMGYDWAVVSDGGVDMREVDTKTMASKRYHNLFFTGDVLHINRPSGGYSLQLCWTTGWVAGSSV